jgi:hypothetical protein
MANPRLASAALLFTTVVTFAHQAEAHVTQWPSEDPIRSAHDEWLAVPGYLQEDAPLKRSKREQACPPNVNAPSSEFSPLQRAAYDGDLERVEYLVLKCNADVNAINSKVYSTALHEAAYQARLDVLKFLISQGADPNLPKVCTVGPRLTRPLEYECFS